MKILKPCLFGALLAFGVMNVGYAKGKHKRIQCPQIDTTKTDTDGMPFCPVEVTTGSNAYMVFRCTGSKKYHTAKENEVKSSVDLINAYKENLQKGISKQTTEKIIKASEELSTNVCRVKQQKEGKIDSYLLVYGKEGSSYSGANMMLRETANCGIGLISAHDDTDMTYIRTKQGFSNSCGIAVFSNQKRGSPHGSILDRPTDLGFKQVTYFFNTVEQVKAVVMVHGMSNDHNFLYRARESKSAPNWKQELNKSLNKALGYPNDHQGNDGFNGGYAIDNNIKVARYAKVEFPVRIMLNRKNTFSVFIDTLDKAISDN